ncbi:MAG: AAA family ATPase [Oscillospiraceae bacterium]|nr:AAA family ATPase [Oscillospiraceae bacterium]
MKIKELYLDSFGKFSGEHVKLEDGINILFGENESGKSSIEQFIQAVFYGYYKRNVKSRRLLEAYEQYLPWGNPNRYEGRIVIEKDGQTYTIARKFLKNSSDVKVYNQAGEDITESFPYNSTLRQYEPAESLLGLSRTAFTGTLSISQRMCRTDSELSGELDEQLVALSQSADSDLSARDAISFLEKQESDIGSERKASPYRSCVAEIERLNRQLKEAKQREEQFFELRNEITQFETEAAEHNRRKQELEQNAALKKAKAVERRLEAAEALERELEEVTAVRTELEPYRNLNETEIDAARRKESIKHELDELIQSAQLQIQRSEEMAEAIRLQIEELGLSGTSIEVLEHFEMQREKALQYNQATQELGDLRKRSERQIDNKDYKHIIEEYDKAQLKIEKIKALRKRMQLLLIAGVIVALAGAALGFLVNPILYALAAVGVLLAASYFFKGKETEESVKNELLHLLERNDLAPETDKESLLNMQADQHYRRRSVESDKRLFAEKNSLASSLMAETQSYFSKFNLSPSLSEIDTLMPKVTRAKQLYAALGEEEHRMRVLEEALLENAARSQALQGDIQAVLEACSSESISQLEEALARKHRYTEALEKEGALKRELSRTLTEQSIKDMRKLVEAAPKHDIPELPLSLESIEYELETLRVQLSKLAVSIGSAQAKIEALSANEKTEGELLSLLEKEQSKLHRLQQQKAAIHIAIERIDNIQRELHNEFGPKLNAMVSDCVRKASNGKYTSLRITRDFEVKAQTKEVSTPIPADLLSCGTADMIYISARLALIDFISGENNKLPLIFDDSFAYLDESRLAGVLRLLNERVHTEPDRQILLFTCHRREERILNNEGIGFTMVSV